MKNIVIAAGYATRLGELTKNFPKPLLKIGENTILGRMLDDIDRIPEIDETISLQASSRAGRRICIIASLLPLLMMVPKLTKLVLELYAICCMPWISSTLTMTCWLLQRITCCFSHSRSLWTLLVPKGHRVLCAMSSLR